MSPQQEQSLSVTTKRINKKEIAKSFLLEAAWEVCNQVGGIYTVIRSKVPATIEKWGNRHYCLLGPYVHGSVDAVFEEIEDLNDLIGRVVQKMRDMGFYVRYGVWLVSGRPRVVLLNPHDAFHRLGEIKYELWDHHQIQVGDGNDMVDQVVAWGHQVRIFVELFSESMKEADRKTIAHFHEWMAGTPIPELRRNQAPVAINFTSHATMLGRYLAMNDPLFYEYLPYYDWEKEAKHFNIEGIVRIERAAAHGSHMFSTVSEVTGRECEHLLGRKADFILPNGLNITRFEALHEFQNLHLEYKRKIHQFTIGHFFPSYSFDLENTLYFFTSGRYEYKNKGFDLVLESLARLNYRLKQSKSKMTVVCFFVTKAPFSSINPAVLNSRAVMDEIRSTTSQIVNNIEEELFYQTTRSKDHKLPDLNGMVDEYLRLRLRRTLQGWKSNGLPPVVTHNLYDDASDPILNFMRGANLLNGKDDPVKVIYHPDFVSSINPLFSMDYSEFVRGCHLGVFPSYYEPWGYTPLECIARGVPTITSDLAGFGDYIQQTMKNPKDNGVYVVRRKQGNYEYAAGELSDMLYNFVSQSRRDRINQRNKTESIASQFDWKVLGAYYDKTHKASLTDLG
jgi:glycogen(starch) synthase